MDLLAVPIGNDEEEIFDVVGGPPVLDHEQQVLHIGATVAAEVAFARGDVARFADGANGGEARARKARHAQQHRRACQQLPLGVAIHQPERRTYDLQQEVRSVRWQDNWLN